MAYTPIGWLNDQAPAINQSNLNKMDNEIKLLDSSNNSNSSISGLRWFDGFYQVSDNNYVSTPYWKMSNKIPCVAGDTIIYCGSSSQSNRWVIVFFDKDGNIITGLKQLGTDFTEITVTIPNNAEYMRILGYTERLKDTYIVYGGNNEQNYMYETSKRISVMENKSKSLETVGILKWFNGYYQASNHSFVDNINWKMSCILPCKPGDKFVYYGKSEQTNREVITFFDKNRVFLSSLTNIGLDFTEVTVTVPDNAEYMRVLAETATIWKTYILYGENPNQTFFGNIKGDLIDLGEKIEKVDNGVAYVDADAESGGDGTQENPYNNLISPIMQGYKRIKAKSGVYDLPYQIRTEKKDLELSLWSLKDTFVPGIVDREKIVVFKGDRVSPTQDGNLYKSSYTPRSGRRFEKVFIDRTLDPIDSSFTLAVAYNVDVFMWKFGHKSKRYIPVLPEDFNGQVGTFTYDNGTIILSPYDTDKDLELKICISDDFSIPIYCSESQNIYISDVVILGAWYGGMQLHGCQRAKIVDCEFICTSHGDGFEAFDSNVVLENCNASGCAQDGFGFQHYGESVMLNCNSFYNGDDGVSHHRGCIGYIDGGEYSYNVSGGITPAFGAEINISDAITLYNGNGLQFFGAQGFPKRNLNVVGCLSKYNTQKDIYNNGYDIKFVKCTYDTQQAESGYSNIFYD